jgi:crotonobetainyl-CoA:carnitine CoA-transferase CaiB-like acyl-CoA transferase
LARLCASARTVRAGMSDREEPLAGLRLVDLASGIASSYLAKLFADAGADVVKVEPSAGDPLRRRVLAPGDRSDADSPLFKFLHAGQRSVVGDPSGAEVTELLTCADIVVESGPMGVAEEIFERFPNLVVVSISPYGRSGPWANRPATEFIVAAESGSVALRGLSDQVPFQAGGRLLEWYAGSFAAVGALAAVRHARRTGQGTVLDCGLLEAFYIGSFPQPHLRFALTDQPPPERPMRTVEIPSIEPTADGWVGFNTNTREQFDNFLILIERFELLGDDSWAMAATRDERRDEWNAMVWDWTTRHTTEEILEAAAALRIPVAPVCNGKTVLEQDHFEERGAFMKSADATFVHPAPPYRINGARPSSRGRAPQLGEHNGRVRWHPRPHRVAVEDSTVRPLAGLRILDATAWWAGPSATQLLAALGAQVIHLESVDHPDAGRTSVAGVTQENWWERSALFLSSNTDKLGVTLDLKHATTGKLAKDLIASCDAVFENFTPRVFDGLGLSWSVIHELNPSTILVRMPAFGLDGPWRDRVGFAQTMEQATGMGWITGHPDDQPRIPKGPCDPLAGLHAAFAFLVALEEREAVHHGQLVEVTMAEVALNAAAEAIIEYTAHGRILERQGNRSFDAAPQGLYRCRGPEQWLALSIATDEQWARLKGILDRPNWATDPMLDTESGRRQAHDEIDRQLGDWAIQHDVEDLVKILVEAGVPAGSARDPRYAPSHPQFEARGLFEEVCHDVVGPYSVCVVPFRSSNVASWSRRAAPMLGEHNREILQGLLGVADDEFNELLEAGLIGEVPRGMDPARTRLG